MSELDTIQVALQKAVARRRGARALRGLWNGLLVGAILSLFVLGLYHLLPLPLWTLPAAAVAPLAGMGVGLLVGGWRKPGIREVARWVDDRQHLKERLSTALEVANELETGAWRDLVIADAAAHARNLDFRRLQPFRLPRSIRWAVVILALGAGLGFVPEYRSKQLLQRQADQERIKQAGRQLSQLTRHELEKRAPTLEPTEKSLQSVAELGDQLSRKNLTRSEAIKDLANVADKLKDQLDQLSRESLKNLEQVARSGGGSEGQTAEGLKKQMEALQKEGAPTANSDKLDQLQKELEKLQQAAAGMADRNAAMTDAQRKQLGDALSTLSRQAEELGLQLPALDQAMAALAANQPELFLKDLQASVTDLEKMREMAKSLQQLQQQMEKLGKDLAEQLQNGQPQAAQSTLRKMIQDLQSANLSSEQTQKMLAEVSKAVDPAGKYGKVGEHLKEAAKQLQQGARQPAAQSLAAAAEELQKLMDQLGDAQQMMAVLDAMSQASMCIGTGQGWRPGARPGKPGFRPGGQPGSGVGTWADGSGSWDGKWTGGWDNSGVKRPDMASRSEKGEGESPEGLKPTKLKGQFSPGGQMPSVTLKGVSIKGLSKVAFEEATTAAQSEADNALSQDKVPRAYQGTVRDYFDDMKQ